MGVHPSGPDKRLGPQDSPALLVPAHPSWESHGRSCPSHCTTGPACSSLSPAPRYCWLQLCPDRRKVKKKGNKNLSCRFLFFGSEFSRSIVGHTQKRCSSHLDFSSFCWRYIWLFSWSLSFLVPLPGIKIKYFSFLDYFNQNMLPFVLISSARWDLPYSYSETKWL